ncbi:hypothetical protein JNB91_23735 [Rhizobium wenxiniae]|uniref:LamG domain-containing protein n=1 Tax=Rhizobium wenxiniae TaxID=1737357 RepID=UPI001C6F0D00|nr:LamG domain-containing protein [Rhizobium wenxiniae]MBW9090827.1 hypothetical protein [Rhizobium wenxiniae]
MGMKIIPPGSDYEALKLGLILPVAAGCQGFFLPNTSAERAVKNWAPGKVDGTLVGSPVFTSGYSSLQSNSVAYIETPVVESPQMTILYAGRGTTDSSTDDLSPVFVSSRSSPGALGLTGGIQLYPNTASTQRIFFSQWTGSTSINTIGVISSYSVGAWQFIAGRITATTYSIRNLTTGVASSEAALSNTHNPGSGKIRIGSMIDSTWKGKSDAAFCAMYDRALSDTEISTVYAWAKKYLAAKGITI